MEQINGLRLTDGVLFFAGGITDLSQKSHRKIWVSRQRPSVREVVASFIVGRVAEIMDKSVP